MEFKVSNDYTPEAIEAASASLTNDNILEISSQIKDVVDKLSIEQFLFVMGCLCKFGTHFERNIDLIDHYLPLIESDLTRLEVENILYVSFLKGKYETEDCYNAYFKIFSKQDKSQDKNITCGAVDNSIWFFSPTPVFLAHTNAMFKLLESNNDYNVKVKIASLSHNDKYQKKCNDLGAEFICLSGNNYTEKYQSLINQSKNALALVWNGPPVHLDYVSKRSDNVVWWSHRFHPKFENVKLRINGDPNPEATFIHFGQEWHYFFSGFEMKNWDKTSEWENRKYNFGSFCRETLIDNEKHWENVSVILSKNSSMTYHYCGRREIHKEWCKKLNIDQKKINFLGWLTNPEREILNMAFLLDGEVLGQGLMGMEALAGKIPIIQPYNTPGFYHNFLKQIKFQKEEQIISQKISATIFRNKKELCSIASDLIHYTRNLEIAEVMHKKYDERVRQAGTFNELINLIKV